MADIRVPLEYAQDSVSLKTLTPELRQTICSLQIENLRLNYLLREIDGKKVAEQLQGVMPQLEIANLIGEWETNREKMIGEIVAHVFKQLYNGKKAQTP